MMCMNTRTEQRAGLKLRIETGIRLSSSDNPYLKYQSDEKDFWESQRFDFALEIEISK